MKVILVVLALLSLGEFLIILAMMLLMNKDKEKGVEFLDNHLKGMSVDNISPLKKTPLKSLLETLQEFLSSVRQYFKETQLIIQKSERSSTRLSRNIQKALGYSSSTVTIARDNSDVANKLSLEISEGSAAVEEIHATIGSLKDQMLIQEGSINAVSESIGSVNHNLKRVTEIVDEKTRQMSGLVDTTSTGRDKINSTDEEIDSIRDKVKDVLDMITVINDIASTTNILSMNAAIEAAHAGDAGRGFAVVAEEIRKLAESTSENAGTISVTLSALVDQIEKTSRYSKESGEAFRDIDRGVSDLNQALGQIKGQTEEVFRSTEDVLASAEQLQQISNNTSLSMGEMGLASSSITGIFENARYVAADLDRDMSSLDYDLRHLNLVMTKISGSFLTFNTLLGDMMNKTTAFSYSGLSHNEQEGSERKFQISNLILSHINWVATCRAVIDGTMPVNEANLIDSHQCELGQWLDRGCCEDDREKHKLITTEHNALHMTVAKILEAVEAKVERRADHLFKELSNQSAKIVEMLMTLGFDQFVSWNPGLSVKIDEFDEQHKILISLIQRLYENMESGQGDDILLSTLDELVDYTDYHFDTEELNFAQYDYPHKEAHIKQHHVLLSKARTLRKELESGASVLSNEVLDFLQDWVMNHILGEDAKYSQFLQGKEILIKEKK